MIAFAPSQSLEFNVDERRQYARNEIQQAITCRRLDHSVSAHRRPEVLLQTLDISAGGVGAFSDQPLDPGELVMVRLPPQGLTLRQCVIPSVVQRCEPAGNGYRVGLMFSTRRAA